MGIGSTIREILEASTQSADRGGGTDVPAGSYWCDDCTERIPAADAAAEPPTCPSCGDPMTLERSMGTTGCAC